MDWLEREVNLIGKENINLLNNIEVTVFGLGGVGSYALEILARTGVGIVNIVDNDVIDRTNINRQLYALNSTIGMKKVDIAQERCKDINPYIKINKFDLFIDNEEDIRNIIQNSSYILDCIDTVFSKTMIISIARQFSIPIISSMGTGNKKDPKKLEVTDISKTYNCPLSKKVRKELKEKGINNVKVVWSPEEDVRLQKEIRDISTISFVPSIAGILMASECVKDLLKI